MFHSFTFTGGALGWVVTTGTYVQDERYAAGAGSAGAACVGYAQSLVVSMAAKVVQCLISGHAVNPSMGARTRHCSGIVELVT